MSDIDYFQLARELGITGRASNDQLVTRCPLHPDTKPSFSMNTRSGLWTCFAGCGTGNFESLVHKVLGGTRAEALDWLAQQRALLPVPNPNLVERSIQKLGGTPQWMEIFADAGRSEMPLWWFERGFTWETAQKFDVRYYAPWGQLIIPFYRDKNLLGTITRNLKRVPKYQNSPGLPRSKELFNLPLPQASGPLILLVEGPLDALWWAQEGGLYPVAALLGLTLSIDHIRLLRNYSEIVLALDNDSAGFNAMSQAAVKLRDAGWHGSQVTYLRLPAERKDVGECAGEELRQAFSERRSFL